MKRLLLAGLLAALACHSDEPGNTSSAPAEEPPVALNAEPAVQYPPDLYDRHVEGDVVLRLYADSSGKLVSESTRVAESSGNAALDTAAVRGVVRLRYAPAYRHGLAISTAFLQTVEFRRPESGLGPAAPVPQPTAVAPRPTRSDTTTRVLGHGLRFHAQLDVRRGDHDVEGGQCLVRQVERAVLVDVDLYALQDGDAVQLVVGLVDQPALGGQPLGAQAVDDGDAG